MAPSLTPERAALLLCGLAAYWLSAGRLCVALPAALIGYACAGGWRFLRIVWLTLPRDWRAAGFLIRARLALRRMARRRVGVAQMFAETAARQPDAVCFLYEDQAWTFRLVDEYSNRVANLLLQTGHRPGQVVAIFAESRPEFACLWLGMAKAGLVGALINFNLRAQSFVHCVEAADAVSLIYGAELAPAVREVAPSLAKLRVFCLGAGASGASGIEDGAQNLDRLLAGASDLLPEERRHRPENPRERLFYIYTSGTTGLPKAAVISHTRFVFMANSLGIIFNIGPNEVLYDCLPLYHTAGGVLGVGQAFLRGATVVIRRKFSASAFWDDCVKYKCTMAQYIGEICRYLLAQPDRPNDRRHSVRLMFGNGLRPQIWRQFQARFGVSQMAEFYGATESNCNIVNIDNKVGAVGFISAIAPSAYPLKLIKVDRDTGAPVRDWRGLCVQAGPGEPGELVAGVVRGDPVQDIDGYVSKSATEKKILRNVFARGDAYFSTGDVLSMDELGYMYFKDRTGDTFRWKGENVSTAEVEACVSNALNLADCTVYGVELPGTEGRAGMAAVSLTIGDSEDSAAAAALDIEGLSRELPKYLPTYARPLFVRGVRRIESTGTFKMKKTDLKEDAYNPGRCSGDPLFYLDGKTGRYLPLTQEVHDSIQSGKIRF